MENKFNMPHQRTPNYNKMFGIRMKVILFILFLLIIGLLFYTAFYNNDISTGDIIGINKESNILIESDLNIPDLNLKKEIKKIEINSVNSKGYIVIGDEKFSLNKMNQNYILLEDFEGNLFLNNNKINLLDGKARGVIINGVNISTDSGRRREVRLTENLDYLSLDFEGIYLNKLKDTFSGEITFGNEKSILNVNNQEVLFSNFNGDINIHNNKMKLKGFVNSLETKGDEVINVN